MGRATPKSGLGILSDGKVSLWSGPGGWSDSGVRTSSVGLTPKHVVCSGTDSITAMPACEVDSTTPEPPEVSQQSGLSFVGSLRATRPAFAIQLVEEGSYSW